MEDILDDESYSFLYKLTTRKIKAMNLKMLQELKLEGLIGKLTNYIYVDELNELRYGTYMRWVKLNDPENLVLTRGALFCDTKITEDGVFLICKNVNSPIHFQIKLDECLLFRKLTDQELVLLAAIDHVSK
jgi:hypothetical protein